METIVLEGRQYEKASSIARRYKYTSDYVGQLCRGKKVDARLVGRTWFVNPESLDGYRSEKYQKVTATMPAAEVSSKHYTSRVDVAPVLSKKTIKIIEDQERDDVMQATVKYEQDDYSLIPHVVRMEAPRYLPVEPADATRIRIHANAKHATSFIAGDLPEVSLSGAIAVHEITDAEVTAALEPEESTEKNAPENIHELALPIKQDNKPQIDASEEKRIEQKPIHAPQVSPVVTQVTRHLAVKERTSTPRKRLVRAQTKSEAAEVPTSRVTLKSPITTVSHVQAESSKMPVPSPLTFRPASLPIANLEPSRPTMLPIRFAPALLVLFAIVAFGLIVSAETIITASEDVYSASVELQAASLLQLIKL